MEFSVNVRQLALLETVSYTRIKISFGVRQLGEVRRSFHGDERLFYEVKIFWRLASANNAADPVKSKVSPTRFLLARNRDKTIFLLAVTYFSC